MLEQSVAKTAVRERLVRLLAAPALIAVTVFAACGGSSPSDTPPKLEVGGIQVTSVPCPTCREGDRPPFICRGPQYALTAAVRIANPSEHAVAVRTARVDLRQNNGVAVAESQAPSVGSVPTQVPGRSAVDLAFTIAVLPGASPEHRAVRASATGVYEDGVPWQATGELVLPDR